MLGIWQAFVYVRLLRIDLRTDSELFGSVATIPAHVDTAAKPNGTGADERLPFALQ